MPFFKKHYKKLIVFGIAKKVFLILFILNTASHADGTYNDVYFTSYEENATLYLVNYYDYQTFKDCYIGSTDSKSIIKNRVDELYTSLDDLLDKVSLNKNQLHYLKQKSHLIEWNKFTNDFGLTLLQTNFLFALTAVLIGFVFLFFFIQILYTRLF